ncbi:protein kinase domain-containing protein [Thermotalea metallivorans]|uniref:Putative serine/threonine-protein kinase YabT n=1 Tax=Thermotalea metallivorans TaxID=520762 RepID=A0A140L090_9FIRM|nr:protein kinase [Thermotalea metallivorans]KXG73965.1 putative serine/threonine-protein kinase YabT [Thermotalea metallivorans]
MEVLNLEIGSLIRGKWNKNEYRVLRLLGEGGIGKVYQVMEVSTKEVYALKLSSDMQSIAKEYEMMKKFERLPITVKVKEIDDLEAARKKWTFVIVEYIEGKNMNQYRKKHHLQVKDVLSLGITIGKAFHILHQNHFVFGDLKLENLMIDEKNHVLKIIDLGGVTPMGESIKEFTPLYDRASWNMGLRRADEGYDLFSLCMLMICLLLGTRFPMEDKDVDKMLKKLENVDISTGLIKLFHRGIYQKDICFYQFVVDLENIYRHNGYKTSKKSKVDMLVNRALFGSILFFLGILLSILIKNGGVWKVFQRVI